MKNNQIKQIAVVTIMALAMTEIAHANRLKDALDGMFMSNTTDASAFKTQTMGGLVGGSFSARTPSRPINVVAFDPPRFSAGCGGVDIFGGSFSFINSEQLVALLRQVGQQAIGVAFQLALKSINPMLADLMTEFQNKIQSLNQMLKNTCGIATQMTKGIWDAFARANDSEQKTAQESTSKGLFDDIMGGFSALFASPNTTTKKAGKDADGVGNLVWKALKESNAGSGFGGSAAGFDKEGNEIVMSLLGTYIVDPDENAKNPDGKEKKNVGTYYAPTLTRLQELEIGTANNQQITLLACDTEDYCNRPSKRAVDYEGTYGKTNRMLFGDKDGVITGDGIISKLSTCQEANCGFTTEQRQFINSVPQPTIALLRPVQGNSTAMQAVAKYIVNVIARDLTINYAKAAIKSASMSFDKVKAVSIPTDQFQKTLESIKEDLRFMETDRTNMQNDVMRAHKYMEQVVKSNPALMAQ